MWHEKGVLLRRTGSNARGGAGVGGAPFFGAWLPLLPRSLSQRHAARDAVEMVLLTAYAGSTSDPLDYRSGVRDPFDIDLDVKAISRNGSVIVSYRVPGGGDTAERVELDPSRTRSCNSKNPWLSPHPTSLYAADVLVFFVPTCR
jgi:hypothetical protein